jgi:hypothetical protein
VYGKKRVALSVIDSLSAGYRFLGRRFELLLVPVLADLAIWLLARLTLGSLLDRIAELYRSSADVEGMPADLAEMGTQVSQLFGEFGETINLMTLLANQSLMHVPSLMRVMGPMPEQGRVDLEGSWVIAGTILGLGALGLLLGAIYLNMLAQQLPIGNAAKAATPGRFAANVGRSWVRIMLFVVLAALIMMGAYVIASLGLGVIALIVPALSTFLAFMLGGVTFAAYFFLYFVTVAIVLDDLSVMPAVRQSVQVVRFNFGATLLFVLLTNLISLGFSIILTNLGQMVPFGTLGAILLNAYIGTGLAMALLVFYRTRWLKLAGEQATGLEEALAQPTDQRDSSL